MIGNLRLLQWLNLGFNNLTNESPELSFFVLYGKVHTYGHIPACLTNMTSLRALYLGSNQLTSTICLSLWRLSYLLELNLSTNSLSGHIALEIGNMNVLRILDLSTNQLSGNIPVTLGDLKDLTNLSLAFNRLEGSIPLHFGALVGLEFLDLSYNNLSGQIPKSLEVLLYLKYLNVSFNKLQGEIPTRGPFLNFSAASFMSNKALCGVSQLQVSPCKGGASFPQILKYILPSIGLIMLASSISLAWTRLYQRTNANLSGDADISPLATWRRISHQEVLHTTEGFSANNILGEASFGPVYKGTLSDEYGSEGVVSTMGDVYSFDILLMETFTKKKLTDDVFSEGMRLKKLVESSTLSLSVVEVTDANLLRNESDYAAMEECLSLTMGLALGCYTDSPEQRIDTKNISNTPNKIKLKFLKNIGS